AGLGDGTRATWSLDPVRRRERVPEGLATSTPPKDVAHLWDQPATVEPLSGNLFVYGRRASDEAELGGLEIWNYSPLRRARPDVELSSLGIRSDVLALARSRQLVAVGSASGLIALIDLRKPMLIPAQLNSPIQFSPDGRLIAYAGDDRSVRVLGDGLRQVASFRLDGGDYVTTLAWNRDGTMLAAGSRGGQFAAWDLAGAERVWSTSLPKGDSRTAWAVAAFSPDGDAIAYGFQKTVRVVDVVDGAAWPGKLVTPGPVLSLAFDPRGRFLATAGDYSVRLWSLHNLRTTEEVRFVSLPGEGENFPTAVATSGDGALVAWHNLPRQTMTLWDVDGFRVIREFYAPGTGIDDVALTADGRRLVTSDSDGGATLWDVRYTDPVGTISDQTTVRSGGPGRLAVDRGGKRFAMSFPDGILISEIGPWARVRAACGLLGRVAANHPQLRSAHPCRAGIR
ncbi:hypothetical protein DMB66_19780, partial [Actinoplanes sp. ATCC 53533]|uniref:WD40 repeat domain-containing protein n=1 Tax=Actinoplanes sp. ATCC 53533 TaxID=1288362 RepID=UPI001000FD6B